MAFLSTLFSAIAAIPKLIGAIEALLQALEKHQKSLELARIDSAQKAMNAATTSEERDQAEKELADALHKL